LAQFIGDLEQLQIMIDDEDLDRTLKLEEE
jgi:hypothetical protein